MLSVGVNTFSLIVVILACDRLTACGAELRQNVWRDGIMLQGSANATTPMDVLELDKSECAVKSMSNGGFGFSARSLNGVQQCIFTTDPNFLPPGEWKLLIAG